eukprot:2144-Heterococcus_DN1.PRE.1
MQIDAKLSASASYIITGKHVVPLTHLVRPLIEAFMAALAKRTWLRGRSWASKALTESKSTETDQNECTQQSCSLSHWLWLLAT